MTRCVALLRGVNVGGVRMKMADLADVVRGLGYEDVVTVLASGNVVFTTTEATDTAKARLESALRERFAYEAWVHVLTQDAVRRIVDAYPFERSDDLHAYVVFAVNPETRAELLGIDVEGRERVSSGDGVLYWTVPKGQTLESAFGRSQGSGTHKQWLTTRNLNTLEKLVR